MNILFFSRLFYPHIGGVEKHVLEISKRLSKEGHFVTVVTENRSWKESELLDGIQIYRIDSGNNEFLKKFKVWEWLWQNRELVLKADVIHCHDVFFWYLPFVLFLREKKVFVTFHGYEGNNIPGFKAKIMHKIAEKMTKGNICVGSFLEKWYGTRANYVTFGAVESTKPKATKVINRKSVNIVFVGRLEDETGILEYLKAVKALTRKGFKIFLTVLGDGSLRKESERLVKKNNINVTFLGFVQNTREYLKKADFVFTSRYLGILEALAEKKYIFSIYNNKIKKDYLTMTPFAKFISIAEYSEDIAAQFEQVLENKDGQKKINDGFTWAYKQTWSKLLNQYYNLWKIKLVKKP